MSDTTHLLHPESLVLAAGRYEELDDLGRPTGRSKETDVGDRLPKSLRDFMWRRAASTYETLGGSG